jgi:predicted nucleotidyltransferase
MNANDIERKIHPKLQKVFNELKDMPLIVFGSASTKGLNQANDLDVVLDLDTTPTAKVYLKPLMQLAKQYYGWIDNFAIKDGILWVRDDEANRYIKAKNSQKILSDIKKYGKPIGDVFL